MAQNDANANDEWESTKGSGEIWNPTKDEEGDPRTEATDDDYIDGFYVDVKHGVGENNATMHTLQIRGGEKDGEKVNVWGTKALNGELEKVRMGSLVRIKWLGKKPTKAGALIPEKKRTSKDTFHAWEVLTNKKVAPLDLGSGFSGSSKAADNTSSNSVSSNKATQNASFAAKQEEDDLPF